MRKIPLEINCIDRCAPALEAGKTFFNTLCAATDGSNQSVPWKINLIKKDIDIRKFSQQKSAKSRLVCAANVFNEIYENIPHNSIEGLKRITSNAAQLMDNLALEDASILTIEPGIPQSGRFISLLRKEFLRLGRIPASPCTHAENCPLLLSEAKKRWCHFAHNTLNAPKELKRLSEAAGIPKDRLVFSYLFTDNASRSEKTIKKEKNIRIISDIFPLPVNRFGCYGCSDSGLILLAGEKNQIEKLSSGSIYKSVISNNLQLDIKSNAIIINIH